MVGLADDELIDRVATEVEPTFPNLATWVEEAHVTRHRFGVPLFPVGEAGRALEFTRAASSRRGVSFCGDYLSGG